MSGHPVSVSDDATGDATGDAIGAAVRAAFRRAGVPLCDAEVAPLARALHRLQPSPVSDARQPMRDTFDAAQAAADFAAALRRHA